MVHDSWRWTINSSSMFTVKSMIDDLTGALEPSERDFNSIIWMDRFLKELSHKAINTVNRLQRRCLICLFLLLGVLCVVLMLNLMFIFLFIVLLLDNFGISF